MRYQIVFALTLMMTSLLSVCIAASADDAAPSGAGDLPGIVDPARMIDRTFIENDGQWDDDIAFIATTSFGAIGIGHDRIYYDVHRNGFPDRADRSWGGMDGCVVQICFQGVNAVAPVGADPSDTIYNYIIGDDQDRWRSDVHGFRSVIFEDLWPGIDARYYFNGGGLKYEFIVHPGAEPSDIRFEVHGAEGVSAYRDTLRMMTPLGIEIVDDGLVSFYVDDGERAGSEFVSDHGTIGFRVLDHDRSRTLMIDPTVRTEMLHYSTYIGGTSSERAMAMDMDENGNVYIAGGTSSSDFPTTAGVYQTKQRSLVVVKLKPDGKALAFSTYFGGTDMQWITDIRVDGAGNAFITGATFARDFPVTSDAYSNSLKTCGNLSHECDLFMSELDPNGAKLLYSTYIGGSQVEIEPSMDMDGSGNMYIVSPTESDDFPVTSDAYQSTKIGDYLYYDLVIFKFDLANMDLVYSTYLGGTDSDVSCDSHLWKDSLIVVGDTRSDDFNVTSDAFMTDFSGKVDSFVLKFNFSANDLDFSTYIGGSNNTWSHGIDLDENGSIFICGETDSDDIPLSSGAFDRNLTDTYDGFLLGLDPTGSRATMCTYVGGNQSEELNSLKVDDGGHLHVVGDIWGSYEESDLAVTEGAFQEHYGGGYADCIYVKVTSDASAMVYSTYIGGSAKDVGEAIEIDDLVGEPVIVGDSSSSDFPVKTGSYDTTYNGYCEYDDDIFALRLNATIAPGKVRILSAQAGDSYVLLNWSAPANQEKAPVTDYQVLRGRTASTLFPLAWTRGHLTYNDTDVVNGESYSYAVLPYRGILSGELSDTVSAIPFTLPSPPLNLTASHGDSRIDLRWGAPEDDGGFAIDHYDLYRTDPLGNTTMTRVNSYDRKYRDTDVTNGDPYDYYVTASTVKGVSGRSNTVSVTPLGVPSEPAIVEVRTGASFVHIIWKAPDSNGGSSILNYTVHRRTDDDVSRTMVLGGDVLDLNDTSVVNGKIYHYSVSCANVEGTSSTSAEVEGTPYDRPTPPTDPTISSSDHTVTIRWAGPMNDGGSPILGYNVYGHDAPGGPRSLIGSTTDLLYTDHQLINGRSYRYSVTATNRWGESDGSIELNATPLGPPSVPGNLTAIAGDGFVQLSWSVDDDGGCPIDVFVLYRGKGTEGIDVFSNIDGSKLSFNDTTVENGLSYIYGVQAVNAICGSPISDPITVVPAGTPGMPSDIEVIRTDEGVRISWDTPSDDGGAVLMGYDLFKGASANALTLLAELGPDVHTYLDPVVMNGTTYCYGIKAFNRIGRGPISDIVQITPSTVPGPPSGLSATKGIGSISLTWASPQDDGGSTITGYRLMRGADGGPSATIATLGPSTVEWTDTNVSSGHTYDYTICAINANGEGLPSGPVRVVIDDQAPIDGDEDRGPIPWPLIGAVGIAICLIVTISIVFVLKRVNVSRKNDVSKDME